MHSSTGRAREALRSAWEELVAPAPEVEPGPLQTRARTTSAVILVLLALSAAGSVFLSTRTGVSIRAAPWAVTLILVATPTAYLLTYSLSRTRYTVAAAGFSALAAGAGAVVAVTAAPTVAPAASTFFMLAAVMLMAGLLLPFEFAAGLGLLNVMGTMAVPSFLPVAGASAVQVPYLFLFANALMIGVVAVVRHQENLQVHDAAEKARSLEAHYGLLQSATREMHSRHLQEMRRLEGRSEAQRHLLDAASHELKTPITPILLQLNLFRRHSEGALNNEQARSLDVVERNLKRLAVLVSDLLDIARMENGKLVLRPEEVPMASILEQAKDTFATQADDEGINIEVEAVGDPRAHVDPTRLSQVLYNLISNALKFSPDGGRIRLRAEARERGVLVQVADDGAGLTPEQQRTLFQPFSQVHDDPETKGTGLGLYISRGIIEQHGGRIWVESDEGKGARFCFWVPADGAPDGRPIMV